MPSQHPVTPRSPAPVPGHAAAPRTEESSTRERVLALVTSAGPVTAAELAAELDLTPAGVRRHLGVLEADGQIAVHTAPPPGGRPQRGRPARHYVATSRGHAALAQGYADLARHALRHLAQTAGRDAVREFAERHVARNEERYRAAVESAGEDVAGRAHALAMALAQDGYAATARPVPGAIAVQLCQGHCPVLQVAAEFPELCDVETQAFSRLLGVHVQRLSTLASGGHVCTTNVPTTRTPLRSGDRFVEGK